MNPHYAMCDVENSGVDLNRNYGIDWVAENMSNHDGSVLSGSWGMQKYKQFAPRGSWDT